MMTLLDCADLSRVLEISEDEIYELARTRQLPFAITTASPRRLVIDAHDLPVWQAAVNSE
jgi:hypothetical protein